MLDFQVLRQRIVLRAFHTYQRVGLIFSALISDELNLDHISTWDMPNDLTNDPTFSQSFGWWKIQAARCFWEVYNGKRRCQVTDSGSCPFFTSERMDIPSFQWNWRWTLMKSLQNPQRCDLPFLQSDVFIFAIIENVDDGLNVRKVGRWYRISISMA